MSNSIDTMFNSILYILRTVETQQREIAGKASDNNELETADRMDENISKIKKWRRNLDALRSEIILSGIFDDSSFVQGVAPVISQSDSEPRRNDAMTIKEAVVSVLQSEQHPMTVHEIYNRIIDYNLYQFRAQIPINVLRVSIEYSCDNSSYSKRDKAPLFHYEENSEGKRVYGLITRREDFVSFTADETNPNSESDLSVKEDSNDQKVGMYIRNRLRKLSQSGFSFTSNQLIDICSVYWSKRAFPSCYLSFAKIFNSTQDFSSQTKDEKGKNRYWNEVFTFGQNELLISSQWYERDKESFDRWYESLVHPTNENCVDAPNAITEELYSENMEDSAIDSDIQNSRKKPTKLTLFGKEHAVKDWTDMFVKTCEVLLLHRPYIIALLDKDMTLNSDRRINFSYVQEDIKYSPKRLSNGLWLETNQSAVGLLSSCHKLLEKCGFSASELQYETVEV